MTDKKPIGVLFIHGIGKQEQGETLVGYSEPLYQWIDRWLKEAQQKISPSEENKSGVQILNVDLRPTDNSPAHTEWLLRMNQDGNIKESCWLLAEAWWAETFAAASFWTTLQWAVQVIPSLIILHFVSVTNRVFRSRQNNFGIWGLLSLVALLFYFPLAIVLTALAEVLVLFLVVLTILPITLLRSQIASIQLVISNWVGDIFLLNTSPIRYAAMISRVRRELKWLEERCDKIAVIAHSQGAAIAYEALLEKSNSSVQRLVTFGSAVKLMKNIKEGARSGFSLFALVIIGILPIAASIYLYFYGHEIWTSILNFSVPGRDYYNIDSFRTIILMIGFIVLLITLITLSIRLGYWIESRNSKKDVPNPGSNQDFKWLDIFASDDPAPDGPLSNVRYNFLNSVEVTNYSNLINDHTTYWQNQDEFVTAVACTISELGDLPLASLTDKDSISITQAKSRRKWRAGWLMSGRTIALLCAPVILFKNLGSLLASGDWLVMKASQVLATLPGVEVIKSTICGLTTTERNGLGAILLLAIPLLWYLLMGLAWNKWEAEDVDKFLKREPYDHGGVFFNIFVALVALLIAVTLFPNITFNIMRSMFSGETIPISWFLCGSLILIIFVVLLYNRFAALRVTQWLTQKSLEPLPDQSIPSPHLLTFNKFKFEISNLGWGIATFIMGLAALMLNLLERSKVWGIILILILYSFLGGLITLMDPDKPKWLKIMACLGLAFGFLALVFLLVKNP